MLLKFLAEHGAQFPIRAAAVVSAPLDLAAASRRMLERRNRVYHWHLLRWMQAESLGGGAALTVDEQHRISGARTILEFDDRFVAPRNGYADAAEYYAENSSARFIAAVRVPTLVIHALDDPWIPSAAYRAFHVGRQSEPDAVCYPAAVATWDSTAAAACVPWHDRCLVQFLARY